VEAEHSGEYQIIKIQRNGETTKWAAVLLSVVAMTSGIVYSYGSMNTRISHVEASVGSCESKIKSRYSELRGDIWGRLDEIKADLKDLQQQLRTAGKR